MRFKVNGLGCTYFVTTTVINHLPVLTIKGVPDILLNNLVFYQNKYSLKIFAYVIMPSHIHLIIWIPANVSVSNVMRDFKKFASVQIRDHLTECKSDFLTILKKYGRKYERQHFKLWKPRSDKVALTTEKVYNIKLNYIHDNPVRAGLCLKQEDYLYSSARNYLLYDDSVFAIDRIV